MKILLLSQYGPDSPTRDGGWRRHKQVEELLLGSGCEVARPGKLPKAPGKLANPLHGLRFARANRGQVSIPPGRYRDFGSWVRRWEGAISQAKPDAVVVEDTRNYYAIAAAHGLGIPVFAIPHNLESFYDKSDILGAAWPVSSRNEFGFLGMCAGVFTISREEQIYLRLRDVLADFLPYVPPPESRAHLAKIRATRAATTPGSDLLLLGTCSNHMTAAGMLEAARWLAESHATGGLPGRIRLAGFQTDRIQGDLAAADCIDFLGQISDDQLAHEYASCRALVAHQVRGVGALTRIPEALLAGIPVLANGIAARSCAQLRDVYTYDSPTEISLRLKDIPHLATQPAPPEEAYARFRAALTAAVR